MSAIEQPKRIWLRYLLITLCLVIVARIVLVAKRMINGYTHKQTGVASTYIRSNGERYFKLVLSNNPGSNCDSVAMPVWSFTVNEDVMSMKLPVSFVLAGSEARAQAIRFVDSFGPGTTVSRGDLGLDKFNGDKSISGWFSVFTKDERKLGSFHAMYCGEKEESEVNKQGKADYDRHLKESGGTTNR